MRPSPLTLPPLAAAGHLRARLQDRTKPIVAAGAHDALSAKLAEEAGFDAVWVSSFGVSAAQKCQPDANVLTMTEMLEIAKNIRAAVSIPVIADCDTGYGDAINVMRTASEFEHAGIAAIALEDNPFPKRCSLYPGARAALASLDEMVGRIQAAKAAQRTPDFVLIARTEALIAGLGLAEAARRAEAYAAAGADAILVHSKSGSSEEVLAFAAQWRRPGPLVVVPTMFPHATISELHRAGFQLIIFANQALRAALRAMTESLQTLRTQERASAVTSQIASLEEVYRVVGVDRLQAHEQQFLPQPKTRAHAVILAAGFEAHLLPLTEDRPKAMLDIKGKTILERQVALLRTAGVTEIAVVRGYRAEAIGVPGITYYDNPEYRTQGIAASLWTAETALQGPVLVLYGDILFDPAILERVLKSPAEITLAIDRAWPDLYRSEGRAPKGADLVITEIAPGRHHRFLPSEQPTPVRKIGQRLDPAVATGEFIGLCRLSPRGVQWLTDAYRELLQRPLDQPCYEAATPTQLSLTDVLQAVLDRGHPVQATEIYKGWLEVDTFDDYRRAWAKL